MLGRVYKIIARHSNLCYVGSTTQQLRTRWFEHKCHHRNSGSDEYNKLYKIMRELGCDEFRIILIQEYEVVDKKHLHAYEQLWINKLSNLNHMSAFQPLEKESRKLSLIKYNQSDKAKQTKRDYRSRLFHCEICNSDSLLNHKSRHIKSKKHQKLIVLS